MLHALLAVGCLPCAIQILSVHPYLSAPYGVISKDIHRILHVAIESVYAGHSPVRNFRESIRSSFCKPKKKRAILARGGAGLVEWLEESDRKSVRGYDPFPKQDISDKVVKFFLDDDDHWTDDIPICQTNEDFFAVVRNFLKFTGSRLGVDVLLMIKLVRIGKSHLSQVSHAFHNLLTPRCKD